jgi:PKD repeat protein
MRFINFVFIILYFFGFSHAQILDFNNPASACLQEQIGLVNTSANVSGGFQWDFCEGELLKPLEATLIYRLNEIDQAAGIVTVQEGGNYYSFVIDRGTNSLHRLEYGTSLRNTPVSQRVELPAGTSLLSPQGISIIRVSNSWYGFVVSTGNNKIYRLDFGSLITNPPAVIELNFSSNLNIPIEIQIAFETGDYYLGIVNFSGNNLVVAKLGNSIANQPQSYNLVALPGANSPYGFSLKKFKDAKWRGIVGSFSNGNFHSVSFENGLSRAPVVSNITTSFNAVVNPVKLALETWGDESALLVMSVGGFVQRVHFTRGSLLTSVASSEILNSNSYGSPLAFSTFYDNGNWSALTFSNSTRDLQILNFNSTCLGVSQSYYSGEIPPVITFSEPGIKDVSILSNIGGILERKTHTITVNSLVAPQIDYSSNGMCVNNEVAFSSLSDKQITQYNWNFGDSNHSTLQNPNHQYINSGSYLSSLTVVADDGCSNFLYKTIEIYSPPDAAFTLPTGLICTNNEFTFVNTTTDNFDGNLSYQWYLNDELKSDRRDLKIAFSEIGDQSIKLKAIIPGCSDEITQVLSNVQSGPTVGFDFAGKCADEVLIFTNQSTGSISSYFWDFDNGITSTEENPALAFTSAGNYDVALQTTGTNGCVSSISKQVTIYSKPQTDLSLDLPPFSCSGAPSQFHDTTPSMPDSNIATWLWTFGDGSANTATQKNPVHTFAAAGDYAVSLTTTTNFGCSHSVVKTVTIAPSPVADFTFGPACVNQGTAFSDRSTSDVKAWQWTIQGSSYSTKNPIHIFMAAASYQATLTVTAQNNCMRSIIKTVDVPVPPVLDFTSVNTCAARVAEFTEVNSGGTDPAVSWTWNFAGQATSTGSPGKHTFPAIGNYSVTMNSTRQSGCTYSITKTIPIISPPKASFSVFLEAGVSPFVVDFTNLSANANRYQWQFGDKNNSLSSAFSPSFTFTDLGDYRVRLTAYNEAGCSDLFEKTIQVVVPKMNAAVSNFRLTKSVGSFFLRPEVTVQNNSNLAIINPDIFLDISGRATISEKINGVIKPGQSVNYTFLAQVDPAQVRYVCADVRVYADENPYDNRDCFSVDEPRITLAPYPNPAGDELMLEWIDQEAIAMNVAIYSAAGQELLNKTYESGRKGLNQVKVDVSALQDGVYVMHCSVGIYRHSFRVIIQR